MKNLLLASFLLISGIVSAQVFDTSPSGSGSGGAPSGSASGDLGGSYPSPTVTHTQAGSVDLSTVTTALSGKLSTTAGIAPGLIDLSTVTTALSGKLSNTAGVAPGLIDLSTVTTAISAISGNEINTYTSSKTIKGELLLSNNSRIVASSATLTYGVVAGSAAINGPADIYGVATLHGAMNISTPTAKTAAYTATSADRVIFASATVGNAITTVTLPSASAAIGQTLSIYKADKSTIPVVIITPAGGADTIVGISTISLFSYGSMQELISDGNHTWFPVGGPLKAPEAFIGHDDLAGALGALTANTMYFHTVKVTAPCTAKSVRYKGGTASGNMSVAMYDVYGNIVLSTGPFTVVSGGSNGESASLATPVYIQPGIYYLGMGADNGTATFGRVGINGAAGYFSLATNVSPPAASITPSAGGSSNNQPAVGVMCVGAQGGYP